MQDTPQAHAEHLKALTRAAKQHDWRVVQDATMRMFDGSSIYDITRAGRHYENFVFGDDWEYVEVGIKTQGKIKRRHKGQKLVHYAIMSVKLPRRLPNVFFDSHKHHKGQFKIIFDRAQRIQLEGNFDKHFTTYFAEEYTIDDLSFITPEVMEALIAAEDYDLEIVHDRLILFGPLASNPDVQLPQMSKLLGNIRTKLLNNILTYRDERVPYDKGRRIVARSGMFLDKNHLITRIEFLVIVMFFALVFGLTFLLAIASTAE